MISEYKNHLETEMEKVKYQSQVFMFIKNKRVKDVIRFS